MLKYKTCELIQLGRPVPSSGRKRADDDDDGEIQTSVTMHTPFDAHYC